MTERICDACDAPLSRYARSDARFCSDACRTASYRERKKSGDCSRDYPSLACVWTQTEKEHLLTDQEAQWLMIQEQANALQGLKNRIHELELRVER